MEEPDPPTLAATQEPSSIATAMATATANIPTSSSAHLSATETNFFSLAFPHICASNARVQEESRKLISKESSSHLRRLDRFVLKREGKLPPAVVAKFKQRRSLSLSTNQQQSRVCAHQRWLQLRQERFERAWWKELARMRRPIAQMTKLVASVAAAAAAAPSDTASPTWETGRKRGGKSKTAATEAETTTAPSSKSSKAAAAAETTTTAAPKKKLKLAKGAAAAAGSASAASAAAETDSTAAFSVAGLPEDEARRALWSHIASQQIPRLSKAMHAAISTRTQTAKKIANAAAGLVRKQFGRLSGRPVPAARRSMKEMLSFWRRNEREERELRKRAEKEAQERRRLEEEQREARRQAKKLNFLITQTELYSHFVGRKQTATGAALLTTTTTMTKNDKEASSTATAAAVTKLAAGTDFADVDDAVLQEEAERLAASAAAAHQARLAQFDSNRPPSESGKDKEMDFMNPSTLQDAAILEQPTLLQVQLKSYQLKGLTWLASLYEQGINGILADEMGLGKTVQSISLLAHLAERQNIWGPFLIVTPASTLHNWQQEFTKFVPALRVIPYWGSVADRKILRSTCMSYWTGKKPVTRDTPFHVMITSYQLIVSDEAFLQKVKWQYMILDEAQAIKSSQSIRWKTLLRFNCRNRLLLTGTPIQNSMQELWALLHFIMPTLFDSHDEFSEWFSKDIESHVEGKSSGSVGNGSLNAHQIQRLHMILKPFMLRRIKRDVQNELGAKIEKNVFCDLSPRQKRLYRGLKEKLPLLELLSRGSDSALMNLVMQFRKICNHPELLERTEITSPLCFTTPERLANSSSSSLLIRPHPGAINFKLPRLVIEERRNPVTRNLILDVKDFEGSSSLSVAVNRDSPMSLPSLEDDVASNTTAIFLQTRLPQAAPIKVLTRSEEAGGEEEEGIIERLANGVGPSARAANLPSIDHLPCTLPNSISIPSMEKFIRDCGKLCALDTLLVELKAGGHRVLLYNQMTRMIDLMEEYLQFRGYSYLRLDGSTNIGLRRDLVHSWQTDDSIFVFLLSTRAGGLGINLTAADTVIFYDSDWNPTVDQQAMDRAHRLGQLKQVTVYRLITRGTIEERIQQRAKQKDEIHKVVIAGGSFGADETEGSSSSNNSNDKADLMSLLLEED